LGEGGPNLRNLSDFRGSDLVKGVFRLVEEHKPLQVSLVGGEPLMRHRELREIVPELSRRGIYTLIVTSAVIPLPVEWTDLPKVTVAVSVDGNPEDHDVRRRDVEELRDHGGHALEMPRAVLPFQYRLKVAQVVPLQLPRAPGVHFGHGGQEKNVYARRFQQFDVFFDGHGIFLKIPGIVELGGVYKNTDHRERVCRPGGEVVIVNHFSAEEGKPGWEGMRGWVERRMAPFADKLGWRPVFDIERVLVCEELTLIEKRGLRPWGLFTMMRFRKAKEAKAAA